MKGNILLPIVVSLCLIGCKNEKQSEHPKQEITAEKLAGQKQNSDSSKFNNEETIDTILRQIKELSFFGHTLILNNEDSIYLQLEDIAKKDRMLSVEKSGDESPFVLTIGNVKFGVNTNNGFMLMTSTHPNDPKMKTVINYLDKYYGESVDEEYDNLKWGSFEKDASFPLGYVHLRRVHNEEGGTVIIFNP